METNVTISSWGNSLAVRIPKDIARAIGVRKGGHMVMQTTAEGGVFLTKPKPKPKRREYTIQELMADTTPELFRNAMSPEDWEYWQTNVGREIITE